MALTKGFDKHIQWLGLSWREEDSGDRKMVVVEASDSVLKDPIDWVMNTLVSPVKFRGASYHAGFFARAWALCESLIEADLDGWEDKRYTFVGHSLGGGVAIIAALLMQEYGVTHRAVAVAAGAPKVCYKKPKEQPGGIYLCKYGSDFVTMLPPWGQKVGLEYHRGPHRWFPSIDDHYPHNYEDMVDFVLKEFVGE